MTKHVTIELTEDLKVRLDTLAHQKGATVESLILEAVDRVLEYDTWYRSKVQEGLDDIKAGRTMTHDEVLAKGRQRRDVLLARRAAG